MTERLEIYKSKDLSNEEYHSKKYKDYLGSTHLKTLSRSLEEYIFFVNCPEEFKKSKSMDMGSAIHCLVLEGFKKFFKEFKIRKKPRKNSFMGNGDTILTKEDFKKVSIWYRKLKMNPFSKQLLEAKNIQTELSHFWEENGQKFKCRFDALINNKIVVDLKTVENTYTENFDTFCNKEIAKRRYHVQAKHYLNGLRNLRGDEEKISFIFLFIEKSAPYRVARKLLSEDILSFAQDEIDFAVDKYKQAKKDNCWIDDINEKITMDDMPSYF